MARYQWLVLTCCEPGREREYEEWYDTQHLKDVCAVPGVVNARRFRIVSSSIEEGVIPKWQTLAIYELETDGNPDELVTAIRARARTPLMPVSTAWQKPGLLLIVAEQVAAAAGNPVGR